MSRQPADVTAATALDLRFGQVGLLQARLRSLDPGAIIDELTGRIASAPQFFRSTAVCLDLASLPQLPGLAEVRMVIDAVKRAGMIVVGVADGVEGSEGLAKSLGLPVLAGFRAVQASVAQARAAAAATAAATRAAEAVAAPAPLPAASLVHGQPVRSGQRVYARERDLVVLGTVGAGAEVMADGCVHIYGTLRGRAMAGCRGDADARLFAREFRAELVAIAGVFRVFEKLPPELEGQSIMAWLEGEELRIARLGA